MDAVNTVYIKSHTLSAVVSTETYQAQYRVLEAFSIFNVILGGSFPRFYVSDEGLTDSFIYLLSLVVLPSIIIPRLERTSETTQGGLAYSCADLSLVRRSRVSI